MSTDFSLILSQINSFDGRTDRQTDIILIASTRDRVCIPCSAVKTTFIGPHFSGRHYESTFNHFDIVGLKI